MFATRGLVAIEHEEVASETATGQANRRIAARSAGTAVGSLTNPAPDTTPTLLTAETEVSMLVLTDTALDRLTSDHPEVAAALPPSPRRDRATCVPYEQRPNSGAP